MENINLMTKYEAFGHKTKSIAKPFSRKKLYDLETEIVSMPPKVFTSMIIGGNLKVSESLRRL